MARAVPSLQPPPEHLADVLERTRELSARVEAAEPMLSAGGADADAAMADLQSRAKAAGLWALGHPTELGGGGLSLPDYTVVHVEQGRSEFGPVAFGSATRQDAMTLAKYGCPELRDRYLATMVETGVVPSLAMTEPGRPGSDPSAIATTARLDGDRWVIEGHKWFVTGADTSPYMTVMCRTEPAEAGSRAYTMIVVPRGTEGVELVRSTSLLGLDRGHWEVRFHGAAVPAEWTIGARGEAFAVAQERLAPGRLLHAARWIGQARRALELLCERLATRAVSSGLLRDKQLLQQHAFDSYAEVESCYLLAVAAAEALDRGESGRLQVGVLKVVGARMQQAVIDRAVQVMGAEALTEDSPLSRMFRTARFGRIYDGPDEVHIESVVRRLLEAAG
jgi:alkylation response protein AidB-like acyl-CoA dehydrogenase